jgi:hypothetical protein
VGASIQIKARVIDPIVDRFEKKPEAIELLDPQPPAPIQTNDISIVPPAP